MATKWYISNLAHLNSTMQWQCSRLVTLSVHSMLCWDLNRCRLLYAWHALCRCPHSLGKRSRTLNSYVQQAGLASGGNGPAARRYLGELWKGFECRMFYSSTHSWRASNKGVSLNMPKLSLVNTDMAGTCMSVPPILMYWVFPLQCK
jgi:hypothetical protein